MTTKQELLDQIKVLQSKVDAMPDDKHKLECGDVINFTTANSASLRAEYTRNKFFIKTCYALSGKPTSWIFGKNCLRETANWFNELADMLEDE